MDLLKTLFSSSDFMPHGYCYNWVPSLVWLHAISDSVIFLAYMTIPVTLLHNARRRKDLSFNWMFGCFGIFIVACGVTHAMEVWNLWHASYWLAGVVKAVTAGASILTAILLVYLVPQALNLPGAADLRQVSEAVSAQAKAARASEAKFRGILESAPDAMVIADGQGRIVLINKETERLFSYHRDELLGQSVDILVPERFRGKHPQHREGYTAHPRTRSMGEGRELYGLRKDNTEFPVEISLSPIETPEGTFISSAIRDVTARRNAKKALRESEERFRLMMSNVKDYAILILDPEGRVISWNEGAERIKGYTSDEIIGQHFSRFYPPDTDPSGELKTAAEQGRVEVEGWRVRKDGSRFWANVVITALRDDKGQLRGFGKITRDVTARKTSENALRASELKFRGILETAPDAMVISDTSGRILLVNAETERLFGYVREDLVGQSVDILVPKRLRRNHSQHRQGYTAHPRTQSMGERPELCGLRKDLTEFPVEISLSPIETPEGTLILSAIRDLTLRKQAQEALNHRAVLEQRSADLKRSNDELEQFAYVAAHDLQEPLRMVASYTQLLAKRYKGRLDSDADEFINFAVDGAHRMQLLITDLLAYCRVGTTGKDLHETSSSAAVEQATSNLQEAIEESGGVVTHDSLPVVIADGVQLVQLFQNLIANAIKYRSAEIPRVHVSATKNGGKEWTFAVRDNGLGIDPKYFDKIFVMFKRLHGRDEFSGTGIGLTVCKKIVERHGGRIWVESVPEKGSTFFFALPEGSMG
jgi:PAS domain S-box-containing protein